MGKIPVGATLAQACRFAFGDFLKILGTMWVGLVLCWIPSILMQRQMLAAGTPPQLGFGMGLTFFAFYLVAIVLMCMQFIGIAKLALGLRHGPYWIYFSLGRPVWRLIGSVLLFIVAMVIGAILLMLGLGLIGALLKIAGNAANMPSLTATLTFVRAILGLVVWCAAFYCLVRLSFLLLPVVAAEESGMALARAWTLGRGNFWRMFAIMLAIWTPLVVLEGIAAFAFLLKNVPFPTSGSAEEQAVFQAALNQNMLAMIAGMQHYWFIVYPLAALVAALIYGVMIGAQCFAWRALVPAAPESVS